MGAKKAAEVCCQHDAKQCGAQPFADKRRASACEVSNTCVRSAQANAAAAVSCRQHRSWRASAAVETSLLSWTALLHAMNVDASIRWRRRDCILAAATSQCSACIWAKATAPRHACSRHQRVSRVETRGTRQRMVAAAKKAGAVQADPDGNRRRLPQRDTGPSMSDSVHLRNPC